MSVSHICHCGKGYYFICLLLMLFLLQKHCSHAQENPAAEKEGDGGEAPAAEKEGDGGKAPAAEKEGDGGKAQGGIEIWHDDEDEVDMITFQNEPIFNISQICEKKCDTRSHTLCKTLKVPICNKYVIFHIFEVGEIKLENIKDLLVSGHNGLRDRIAKKMLVGNMVRLIWDDSLAKLALKYFMQCDAEIDDPCSQFNIGDDLKDQLSYHEEEKYKWVAQNRYTYHSEFFPVNFIEQALRHWYFEKDDLEKPDVQFDKLLMKNLGVLKGENNFTHMAFPLIFKMGCSLAQIDQSYSLICNYYPYYRTSNKEMIFIRDNAAASCPNYFPMRDNDFEGLCTDHKDGAKLSVSLSYGIILLPLTIVIFC